MSIHTHTHMPPHIIHTHWGSKFLSLGCFLIFREHCRGLWEKDKFCFQTRTEFRTRHHQYQEARTFWDILQSAQASIKYCLHHDVRPPRACIFYLTWGLWEFLPPWTLSAEPERGFCRSWPWTRRSNLLPLCSSLLHCTISRDARIAIFSYSAHPIL